MPYPARSYLSYVDDSGNEQVGTLWVALAIPFDLWSEYLSRWLSFRQTLYNKTGVPASYELHAQVWLSPDPLRDADEDQREALANCDVPEILVRGKFMRRERSQWYEKALQTIGTFTEARVLTVYCRDHSGHARSHSTTICCASRSSFWPRGRATLRCLSTELWTAVAISVPLIGAAHRTTTDR